MAESLTFVIENVLNESKYEKNPYFSALNERTFKKEDFIETQIQFFFAVTFFNRPMAALAAKIPTPELRMEIVRNVWEEHGEGDLNRIHSKTFMEFLTRLAGVSSQELTRRALWPEVRAFNTALSGACVLDEYLVGAATLGIIERMFCNISFWIGKGITENAWLQGDELIHYSLHQNLDVKHSEDFFDVLKPAWEKSAENRYTIEQGLRLGAYLFNTLYLSLYENRTKRVFRDVTQ